MSTADFYERFPDEDACWRYLREQRWGPDQFDCPACGETEHGGLIQTRKLFECYACGKQTSLTAGTVLEDTKLDLQTWFLAAYYILTTKKSIRTPELARKVGFSERTAWFVHHKLTTVLGQAQAGQLLGTVEVDEEPIGGQEDPPKAELRTTKSSYWAWSNNARAVLAGYGSCRFPTRGRASLHPPIKQLIPPGSTVRTDRWRSYLQLEDHEHDRAPRDHPKGSSRYIPRTHLVFGNLKTVPKGVHGWCSAGKLQAYLDLFAYRFNHRDDLKEAFEQGVGCWFRLSRCGGGTWWVV
jgi:transposase-like protein